MEISEKNIEKEIKSIQGVISILKSLRQVIVEQMVNMERIMMRTDKDPGELSFVEGVEGDVPTNDGKPLRYAPDTHSMEYLDIYERYLEKKLKILSLDREIEAKDEKLIQYNKRDVEYQTYLHNLSVEAKKYLNSLLCESGEILHKMSTLLTNSSGLHLTDTYNNMKDHSERLRKIILECDKGFSSDDNRAYAYKMLKAEVDIIRALFLTRTNEIII